MNNHSPRIVLGMPVYNGEKHIGETLDSILAQTVRDFRLLISDNASTDGTGDICREYAKQDDRIVYHRQPENLGFARNFNFAFQPNGAPYFKWAAHDDLLKPTYLERCLELLEQDASLSMAHCITMRIDEDSKDVGRYYNLRLDSDRVSDRFWRILWIVDIYEVYAVMRSDLVAKTNLAGIYVGSERTMLAKMLLQGNIGYVEEGLFSRRDHAGAQTAMHIEARQSKDYAAILKAQAPKSKIPGLLAPGVRFQKYLEAIMAFPMSVSDRLTCLRTLIAWSFHRTIESATGNTERYRDRLYADLWAAADSAAEQSKSTVEPPADGAEGRNEMRCSASLPSSSALALNYQEVESQLSPFNQ